MNREEYVYPDSLLEPENMLKLYAMGAFPMADAKDSTNVQWYMPETRTIIRFPEFNIPRSLKKHIADTNLEIRFDYNVEQVIHCCADREETWISQKLIRAYRNLIHSGHMHSVEVYQQNEVVGGLYGISYKGAFFGESMFSKKSQASKIALAYLMERLCKRGYVFLDVQYETDHLKMFGIVQIPLSEYKLLLVQAYRKEVSFL